MTTQDQIDQLIAKADQIASVGGSLLSNASLLKKYAAALTPDAPPADASLLARPAESASMAYFEKLPGATTAAKLGTLGQQVAASFDVGTFECTDFRFPASVNQYGILLGNAGMYGRGVGHTVLRMTPHTSTQAGQVPPSNPPASNGQTNPLYLVRLGLPGNPAPTFKGFTLEGTPQGHQYHGLRLFQTTGGLVEDVRTVGFAGDEAREPGEIFPVSTYRATGVTFRRVYCDGTDGNGKAVAAAGLQCSFGGGMTFEDCESYDTAQGSTFVLYEVTDAVYRRCKAGRAAHNLWNLENVNGTVLFDQCTFGSCGANWYQISLTNNHGSAKVTIADPILPGGGKLRLRIGPYAGKPSTQDPVDIKVTVGGVDRTADLLDIITTH